MKLARLCLLKLKDDIEDLVGLSMTSADKGIEVGPIRRIALAKTFLVPAIVRLNFRPKITKDQLIVVPSKSRELAEQWAEHFCNLIAVSRHTNRKLVSPDPPLALIPEDEGDDKFLKSARGFAIRQINRGVPFSNFHFELKHFDTLSDRLDGLAILAEALGHDHETGRFREFIRLFERAFSLGGHRLTLPLAQFLAGAKLGYSEDEVRNWAEIRDRVTHADRNRSLLFEADVAWVSRRMMQAAYDILLNKVEWRNAIASRRNLWQPIQGTTSADADIFLTQGAEAKISFQLFDQFRRFPSFLGSLNTLPKGWWSGPFVVPGKTPILDFKATIKPSEQSSSSSPK
jgi:hypothetical protein